MEFTKEIIFNFGYKRLNLIKEKFEKIREIANRLKEFILFVFCILKKWTSKGIEIVKNNKMISTAIFLLIFFMIADFILIDNFMKIFATLR